MELSLRAHLEVVSVLVGGDGASLDEELVDAHQPNDVATRYVLNGLRVSTHHQDGPGEGGGGGGKERERERGGGGGVRGERRGRGTEGKKRREKGGGGGRERERDRRNGGERGSQVSTSHKASRCPLSTTQHPGYTDIA